MWIDKPRDKCPGADMDKTHRRHRGPMARMEIPRGLLVLLGVLVAVVITVALLYVLRWRGPGSGCPGGFLHGSVAADSGICSSVGRDILKQGGSPVDGAIAALLCTSVINPQSMGLGGGVIFTIYNASTGQVEVINARERVPSRLTPGLIQQCKDSDFLKSGVQWIGVPGELRGYEAAHRSYGRLPWKTLFEPTIKLITEGVKVAPVLHKYLSENFIKMAVQKSSLCELFCKGKEVLQYGDVVNFTQLANTLRTVANEGADSFYQGSLAQQMIDDLQTQGSNLTMEDFRNYKVNRTQALRMPLGDSYTLYSAPPPAGGALLGFILNVLQGYNFSAESMKDETDKTETYHKIAEVFKFANGQKARLVESQRYSNTELFTSSLLSQNFARSIRRRIDSSGNHSLSHYDVSVSQSEIYGTSHISVISQDGSSVSVTSSINRIFGSMAYSPKTGVIFNNQLADFCNAYPKDQIPVEGEQPPSSMCPSIILSHDKKFQLVIGGSGGSFIISSVTQAIMNRLWFGTNLSEAIVAPILHVNGNNQLGFEGAFDTNVSGSLLDKGHQISPKMLFFNVVQAVSQEGSCLFAHSDVRKLGKAVGY